jgi:hypothetical protein
MLDRILRGVMERLEPERRRSVDPARVVALDDSQGPRRGCLLLLFDAASDAPVLIAKGGPLAAARMRGGKSIYEIEFENLQALQRMGMNDSAPGTPEPLGLWRDDELLVTLQAGLPGRLLKNVPGPELFRPDALAPTLDAVLDWWERLQRLCGVQRAEVTEGFYETRILRAVDGFRRRFALEPDEIEFLERRFLDERRLAGLELPLMAQHGDFCPANMVQQGNRIAVFDWEFPLRHRLPLFDLFHFFGSLRFPFGGPRGESTHFASFVEVFWGEGYFQRALRERLRAICAAHAVPETAVEDLFLLALIRIANLKYEALVEIFGAPRAADAPTAWEAAGGTDKDVPFACIRDGVFENLRHVVRAGLPPLLREAP